MSAKNRTVDQSRLRVTEITGRFITEPLFTGRSEEKLYCEKRS